MVSMSNSKEFEGDDDFVPTDFFCKQKLNEGIYV